MPLLSVIMPCWNAFATVDEAVRSIVDQSIWDWELIAIDDGSTDGTLDLLKSWAVRDTRIRVLPQGHEGIVSALRLGCGEAQGDYWARMDADDISLPARFERQLDCLHNEPEMTLCGTLVETIGTDVQSGRARYERWLNDLVTHEAMSRERFIECPIAHPTFMASRECFQHIAYADTDAPEDYDFVLRAHDAGVRLTKVPEKLLQWRDHAGRFCLNDDRYSPDQFRWLKRTHLTVVLCGAGKPIWQWGAGEVGKAWLREWDGVRPERVVDINPRKFGKFIHGYEVVAPEALPLPGESVIVVAVGAPGARAELRAWFSERGYAEAEDYWFVA